MDSMISDGASGHTTRMTPMIEQTIKRIEAVDKQFLSLARQHMDNKTKPIGALGRLENIAVTIALVQHTLSPDVSRQTAFVFAADHGVSAEGVSAYPPEVTAQMVLNFLGQGAAINVICRNYGIDLHIVDVGVNYDFGNEPGLIDKKVKKGTGNFAREKAMTAEEACQAVENGIHVFNDVYEQKPFQIVAFGEMGIGNTTSAAAITSVVTGKPPEAVTGTGTGIDAQRKKHKVSIIESALNAHKPSPADQIDILTTVGGFEIAAMAGAMLAAASKKVVIVLDGFIATAAALIAANFSSHMASHCLAGHKSYEQGHMAALDYLGLAPVLDLGMRLGEGTGAAITMDIARTAVALFNDMATFEEADVSRESK